MEDRHGRIWAGTLEGRIAVLEKGKWILKKSSRGLQISLSFDYSRITTEHMVLSGYRHFDDHP